MGNSLKRGACVCEPVACVYCCCCSCYPDLGRFCLGFCLGIVSVLSRYCLGVVSVLSWFCLGFVSVLSRHCLGVVSVLSRCCLGVCGNTLWKHAVETQCHTVEIHCGNTLWIHTVETHCGNTLWKHTVDTPPISHKLPITQRVALSVYIKFYFFRY